MDRKSLLHRQRTGILVTNKQRKRSPKKTYSKAINPLNLQTKPMSLKNLDLVTSSSSESSLTQEFEDNKSCCCEQCSKPNKKVKSLQKRFILFRTQYSVVRQIRLHERFRNAVYCIILLILRKRKLRQLEKQKKMYRYKTKVFLDGSPLMQPQQMLQHSIHIHNEQNQQSIQAKIIDQRHKQRQSVKIYLQQKLHEKEKIIHELTLPKIHKFNQNSFTSIQPLRFPQDSKSPRCSTQLKITDTAPHSPYLHHDTIIQSSFCKTPRPAVTKSISQETLTNRSQFHIRKSTATTLKGLI